MRTPPASIAIMAYDECDELDVMGPFAVLQTANRYLSQNVNGSTRGTPVALSIVATDGAGTKTYFAEDKTPHTFVTGVHGATIAVTPWDGTNPPDILIVAGGNIEPNTGIVRQAANAAFVQPIKAQLQRGAQLVSICTSALGLAIAGVIQGRTLTTHPGLVGMVTAQLAGTGARVLDPDWEARVVDDGNLISCGGVTSGIDEALYLLRAFWLDDVQLEFDVRSFVDFTYRAHTAIGPHFA